MKLKVTSLVLVSAIATVVTPSGASGQTADKHPHAHPSANIGTPGDASQVTRTVQL